MCASVARVGEHRIAYERRGDGPPLIMLPGYIGDGPGTFPFQLKGLSDAFTVVAWDPPGSGQSSDPPHDFRLADYADVLAGFVQALGYSKVHTLGISFGAGLALEFYRRFPSVSSSLILVSGYAGWAGSLPPDEVERRLEQVRRLADETPARFVEAVLPSMFSGTVPQRVADEFGVTLAGFHPAGLRSMAEAFAVADLTDSLSSIAVPTLLIYGDKDVRAPKEVREALHDAIPGSQLVVLNGAGHVSTLEAPERVNEEVRSFLERVPI